MLVAILGNQGHEVHAAYDGVAAVEVALRERPEVILLDIGLPGLNGHDACRAMRAGGLTATLIVAMTGHGLDEDRRRSAEAGFDAHHVKPVKLQAIRDLLARVMAG